MVFTPSLEGLKDECTWTRWMREKDRGSSMFKGMQYEAAYFIQYTAGSSEELEGKAGRVRGRNGKQELIMKVFVT